MACLWCPAYEANRTATKTGEFRIPTSPGYHSTAELNRLNAIDKGPCGCLDGYLIIHLPQQQRLPHGRKTGYASTGFIAGTGSYYLKLERSLPVKVKHCHFTAHYNEG